MGKIKWFILGVIILAGAWGWKKYGYLWQSAKNWPRATQVTTEPVELTPTAESDQELEHIKLAEGATITYFAKDVPGARSLARGGGGVVYVGTRGEGVVYAVEDKDNDGRAERRVVVANGLNTPNGVAYQDGDLYVAEISRVIKFANIDQRYDKKPDFEVVFDDLPSETHHGWRYIGFGPDGKLYVAIGAPCNICDPGDPFASLTRISPEGGGLETVARGIRNSVGFDWDPNTGKLWFTDNGRDLMGDDLPPDELNRLDNVGEHFGYPYCHGQGVVDPQFGQGGCDQYKPPVVELGPHVAALGMKFVNGKIYIPEHGSWNRSVPIGYRITTVDPQSGLYQVFAEGWLEADGTATGRPVDILVMDDRSILVSDDKAGAVYRISF